MLLSHNMCITAHKRREVAKILLMKQLRSMLFYLDTHGLTVHSNQIVVSDLHGYSIQDLLSCDDYIPLLDDNPDSSVHCSMNLMPIEHHFGYRLPVLLDIITDLQLPPANRSAKTIQCCKFIVPLQRIMAVDRDELHKAQEQPTAEADRLQHPNNPTITVCG